MAASLQTQEAPRQAELSANASPLMLITRLTQVRKHPALCCGSGRRATQWAVGSKSLLTCFDAVGGAQLVLIVSLLNWVIFLSYSLLPWSPLSLRWAQEQYKKNKKQNLYTVKYSEAGCGHLCKYFAFIFVSLLRFVQFFHFLVLIIFLFPHCGLSEGNFVLVAITHLLVFLVYQVLCVSLKHQYNFCSECQDRQL